MKKASVSLVSLLHIMVGRAKSLTIFIDISSRISMEKTSRSKVQLMSLLISNQARCQDSQYQRTKNNSKHFSTCSIQMMPILRVKSGVWLRCWQQIKSFMIKFLINPRKQMSIGSRSLRIRTCTSRRISRRLFLTLWRQIPFVISRRSPWRAQSFHSR